MVHPCAPSFFHGFEHIKISFGGIPNRRDVLFFLKRVAKPSAGNTPAGLPWIKWPQILLNLTWLCTKASQTFSGTLLNLTWLCTEASQTFSGTFSRTLLNLTWLCTKASRKNLLRNLLRNPVEPDLALHQSLPDLLRNLLRNLVEPPLALHQSLPEPSPEPCWIWPGSAPKLPRLSPEPSPEPCWTWPGSAPKPPGTFPGTFGTFSGTSLNLFRRLHQCTPQLFWAEAPISLRCWGKMCFYFQRHPVTSIQRKPLLGLTIGCVQIQTEAAAPAVQDEGPKKEAWSFVQLGQQWAEHPVALSS